MPVIPSFIDELLGCFCISAIVNNANMNIGMNVPFKISVFVFFKYIPNSGIAGSDNSSCFFEKPSYYFTWWLLQCTFPLCINISLSPHFHQHLLFVFILIAILTSMRWYLIVYNNISLFEFPWLLTMLNSFHIFLIFCISSLEKISF